MNLLITGAWRDAQEHIEEIERLGHEVVFMQWEKDEMPCDYCWVEGVICNGFFLHYPISSFQNLKYIQLTSAGFDRVDLNEVKRRKIDIYNARGVYSIPMAEYAVAGVLSVFKRIVEFHEQQKNLEWKKIREIRELSGKRVVIVGCGDVGRECAKRFQAFDCEVVGVNRTVRDIEWFDAVVGLESLDRELENADVVIVAIALTEATRGIVKAGRVKPEGVLVNISRGGTVDLSDAKCQLILDVFENEPLDENDPLWESSLITPHNSFVSEKNADRLSFLIMNNLERAK